MSKIKINLSSEHLLNTRLRIREAFVHDDERGLISFGEDRLLLLHAGAFGAMRRELIDIQGFDAAKETLTRMGFVYGTAVAKATSELVRTDVIYDQMLLGRQIHTFLGMVRVENLYRRYEPEEGIFECGHLWHDSVEAEQHLQHCGVSTAPVCWMQSGFASGFISACLGRTVLFKEVQCRGRGDPVCQVIGKNAELWNEPDDKQFLTPHDLLNRGIGSPTKGETYSRLSQDGVVGASSALLAALRKLDLAAPTDATILIYGETGVGKERFAQIVHTRSQRAKHSFVAVNCAAIPDSLFEAELFGTEIGAFTGSIAREGKFERASKGTLFLDEVGTLSLANQSKLLRVIQESEVERIGSKKGPKSIDVRLVCATNVNLAEEVKAGRFRADLYYRLNVVPITIPPLRKRREDIPLLTEHFLRRFAEKYKRAPSGVTERCLQSLLTHDYPGNVRELENLIERAVILTPDGYPIDDWQMSVDEQTTPFPLDAPKSKLAESAAVPAINAREAIARAVEDADGNLSKAALALGLTRAQLSYRLAKQRSR